MSRDASGKASGSRSKVKPKAQQQHSELEAQFILRLPSDHAELLREEIDKERLRDHLRIEILGDNRHATVKFHDTSFSAKLMTLPSITESWKTLDRKSFWKTADICQLLVCRDEDAPESTSDEDESKFTDPYKKQQAIAKKFQHPHGLTPPLKNVKKKRFRKTAKKKYIEAPEVEKEVKRLLRADISAVDVTYEVLQDEDKPEDTRSVASDLDVGTSMTASPSNMNEDSLQYGGSELDAEESAILPDISSSEEEVDMADFVSESNLSKESLSRSFGVASSMISENDSRQMDELQQTLLDVQSKREEQEMRVKKAANPFLKQRFQAILDNLLQKEKALLSEINDLQVSE